MSMFSSLSSPHLKLLRAGMCAFIFTDLYLVHSRQNAPLHRLPPSNVSQRRMLLQKRLQRRPKRLHKHVLLHRLLRQKLRLHGQQQEEWQPGRPQQPRRLLPLWQMRLRTSQELQPHLEL